MTVFRAKISLLAGLYAVLAVPVFAQAPDAPTAVDTSRAASFLPSVTTPRLAPPPTVEVPAAPLALAPAPAAPITTPVSVAPAPVASVPVPSSPPSIVAPPSAPSALPSVPASLLEPAPVAATPAALPAAIAKPVEIGTISTIDPESIGLNGNSEGGLSADMWKGTSRPLALKLFQALNLPTVSKALNDLARRLLLTTAAAPEGAATGNQSLTSLRVEKLLALGAAGDAWKLAVLARPEQIDEISLRLVAEAALISPLRDDVCAKLPDIVKVHNGAEWQKLMLVCQLRAKDTKAAQLTLDLLHAQNVKDDIFFFVAEKNIIGGTKQLPRQLTPLKPLTLALLQLTDLPLPGEIYVHPDAALIPDLLAAKAREDVARIGLAERAAERGLVSGADLVAVYASTVFPPEAIAAAANSPESGPRLHALLYQAALQEKSPQNRIAYIVKFMQSVRPTLLNNAGQLVLDNMLGSVAATAESHAISGVVAHIYVLVGKNDAALEWLKLARHAAIGMPSVTAELNSFWPLTVLSGLESSADYPADLVKWLDAFLKTTDGKGDGRAQRDEAAQILLLLDADGFAVPNDIWATVMDTPTNDKRIVPSALFLERLKAASTSPRKAETIVLALDLAGNGNDIPFLSVIEIVRALRLAGLTSDAAMFARENAALILAPNKP